MSGFGEYWVVRVSFRPGNPAHVSIGCDHNDGHWLLFNSGYEEIEKIYTPLLIKKGGSFEKIRKINIAAEALRHDQN